jgi:thymidylate kinase
LAKRDPERFLVIDAFGDEDAVAHRVAEAVATRIEIGSRA